MGNRFKSGSMLNLQQVASAAKNAARVSGIVSVGILVTTTLRAALSRWQMPTQAMLLRAVAITIAFFVVVFFLFFVWNLVSLALAAPVNEILEEETPDSELLKGQLFGFVVMEYFALILNRTFVVFAGPEGLYGWKACGPVTNANRRYFEPLQEMAQDREMTRDLPAIRKLAGLRGGFFYPRAEIASVSSDDRGQWGMGGLPNSGHVQVRLVSGSRRNFIVLGEAIPDEVRDRITAALGVGIPS
jgi:hypothetical protein